MKNKSIAIAAITFFSGIVAGITALTLIAFTPASGPSTPQSGIGKISVNEARALFQNYYQTAEPVNGRIKGFSINRQQLQALNQLAGENPALAGFRFYMGKDVNSASVGIVVGLDGNGTEVNNIIYETDGSGSSPCPPICDATSQIGK